MEETRMDLSHQEEGSGRSMRSTPHQGSPLEEMPVSFASEEPSVAAHQSTAEEDVNLEGGLPEEGDDAAELVLLGDTSMDQERSAAQDQDGSAADIPQMK